MANARRTRSAPAEGSQDPVTTVRDRADALYRTAVECCRQHDRAARLHQVSEPGIEHRQVDAMCTMCDGSLTELAEAYAAAASEAPHHGDEAWWHKANGLWHASREYARRHAGSDALSGKVSAKHRPDQLGTMQMEYELEASALLALRHAADAYRKARPDLV